MYAMSQSLLCASRQSQEPRRGCGVRAVVVNFRKQPMTDRGHTRGGRRACGLVCLMALLLYTPAAHAAWLLLSGACCATDHCPIAAHRHASEESGEAASDCGHAMGHASQAAACSISCCP